jgi:hypothetical protein
MSSPTDRRAKLGFRSWRPSSERVTLGWDEVRALYPGTADVAYLDSAAVGLVSTRVRDAVTAVLKEHQQLGSAAAPNWPEHAGGVRTCPPGATGSLRGSGLRFARHYFTTDSDLHRAADTLPRAALAGSTLA